MDPRKLEVGDVVQINPDQQALKNNKLFGGCLMVVTEPKSFGAQGYILIPRRKEEWPAQAFYRAAWEEMEYVGFAPWTLKEGS